MDDPVGKIRVVNGTVNIEWNIKHYAELSEGKDGTFYFTSSPFEILAATWQLVLYPSDLRTVREEGTCPWPVRRQSFGKEYVSIYLRKNCSKIEKHCVYFLLEIQKDGEVVHSFDSEHTFTENSRFGSEKNISADKITNLGREDTVTIILQIYPTGSTIQEVIAYSNSTNMPFEGFDTLLKNMEDLYLNQEDCDFKIRVKTREFGVHKTILAARSPVFNAMLHHDMKEKNTGIVQIEDFEPDIFNDFLLYLYTGRTNDLSWQKVTELYALGDKYGLQCLKKECVMYMRIHLSVDRFSEILDFAVKHEESKLLEDMENFFV